MQLQPKPPQTQPRRLRVALISHIYLEGYYGKLKYLAQAVDLTLVVPKSHQSSFGVRTVDDLPHDMPCDVDAYGTLYCAGYRSSTRWILRTADIGFRRLQPDIIHIENERHSFAVLQALISRRCYAARARVVVSMWANQEHVGWRRGLRALESFADTQIDSYICGNIAGRDLLCSSGVGASRVSVIPLVGVDTAVFVPAESGVRSLLRQKHGFGDSDFVIAYIGRLVPQKGLLDLAEACHMLGRAHAVTARVVYVGTGPLRDQLGRMPNSVVVAPGFGAAVVPFYQLADAVVLPSRTTATWAEQFGRVLVEAMSCGVPVVGSTSGAIPEVVGDAGLLYKEGDSEHLAAQLGVLAGSIGRRRELAYRGRMRVERVYSDRAVASQTAAAYDSVLGGSDVGPRVRGHHPIT